MVVGSNQYESEEVWRGVTVWRLFHLNSRETGQEMSTVTRGESELGNGLTEDEDTAGEEQCGEDMGKRASSPWLHWQGGRSQELKHWAWGQ